MKNQSILIAIILLSLTLLFSRCKKLTEEIQCEFSASVTITNITNVSVDASWATAADAEQYLFEYRKVGAASFTVVRVTSGTSTKIINLVSSSTYEYRVQTNCPGSNSDYTEVKQFTTKSNNEFNIVKKWRMKFFKENNVEVNLGPNDFMDFASGGVLSQALTVGGSAVVTNGTWSLFSANDSVSINLSTTKKWEIQSLSTSGFLLVKNSADSLRFEPF